MSLLPPDEPRFLCDHMLGSLARWLRFLGYDTQYPGAKGDTELLALAGMEGRILLTRDKELAGRAKGKARLIRSVVWEEQIAEIREGLGLDFSNELLLSRCSRCNTVLVELSKKEAAGEKARVPEAVLRIHEEYWRCPGCGQVYWPGSHYERIRGKIAQLGKGARGPGPGARD